MLSSAYAEIKRLRCTGHTAAALAMLKVHRPASDGEAFEAAVCLFMAGDINSMMHVCAAHGWKESWAIHMSKALAEMLIHNRAPQALTSARTALQDPNISRDALAFYLSMLQANGLLDEAFDYVCERLHPAPLGETFLLTVMAEIAAAAKDWTQAYQLGCAVVAMDPLNHRALIVLSTANFNAQNFHEALGNALCANLNYPGSVPATLQIMRCQNKLGDHYSAIAAFDALDQSAPVAPEIHIELGIAYAGLERMAPAIAAYRRAVTTDPLPVDAIRALLRIYLDCADTLALAEFSRQFASEINDDTECIHLLALEQLRQGHLDDAATLFSKCHHLNIQRGKADAQLPWPVPEPRIRHDYEQLDLLRRRNKLSANGLAALRVLQPYYDESGNTGRTFAPEGAAATALKAALCDMHYKPANPFNAEALGRNDYAAIERQYESEKIVIIDNFLSPTALAELRRYSEEATVWKMYNAGGYFGALLIAGFAPKVLLAIADELRRTMPRVIKAYPLLQAWGFKYDQRLQGINLHADFAKVNVNFWITPNEACADPTTGGMVVYDYPVPKSWSFEDYNINPQKLKAYLKVHDAKPLRVPYRENRCVIFDSSLIHVTDELHFKPGYENRRVNITLLFGRARSTE